MKTHWIKNLWLVQALMGFLLLLLCTEVSLAQKILIYMDQKQTDHLRAYGVAYWTLQRGEKAEWLLNYRGGSFMTNFSQTLEDRCNLQGVGYSAIDLSQAGAIYQEIEDNNMEVVILEKVPKIGVYVPPNKEPWDDAVRLALEYAEIPYQTIWDEEVLKGEIYKYDWVHLHHEDFTGQYGKFYSQFSNMPWYVEQVKELEDIAQKHGFHKVSQLKLATAKKIKEFVAGGGFLFAMCSATDTYDIALAAEGVDICERMYDGDGADPQAQQKLNYDNTLAFTDFRLKRDPYEYEFSDIDNHPNERGVRQDNDYFSIFEFSAKWDPIPTMLTQNHTRVIPGFFGQTTGFKKHLIKPDAVIMGENKDIK